VRTDGEDLTRRVALQRFAALTAAAWGLPGTDAFAAPARRLTHANAATLKALADVERRSHAVRRLTDRIARRPERYGRWANLVLETLEHAPDAGRFSQLSRHARRDALRQWWTLPDPTDAHVFQATQDEPETLAASTQAALDRIRANQTAGRRPATPRIALATDGPLDSEVRRLRHLRGAAVDLLDDR
jgi:hypothetical protein